jgi:4-methyl-5(b-hydroxyethyl)-thiazole monophosphate biosynthesis
MSNPPAQHPRLFSHGDTGAQRETINGLLKEKSMLKKVLVPIADGTEEIEAVVTIDVLRRAGAEVTVASVMGDRQVTASRQVNLVADKHIKECTGNTYDLIALPGGMLGAKYLRDCKELIEMLKNQVAAGRLYGAICASPAVILEHHGLLQDKKATCHAGFAGKLKNQETAESRVVVDSNCITSRGPGTAVEFALQLVEELFGLEKRKEVAGPMHVVE